MFKKTLLILLVATAFIWISEAKAQTTDYLCNPIENVAMPARDGDGVHCVTGGVELLQDATAADYLHAFTAKTKCGDDDVTFYVPFEGNNWESMYLQFLSSLLKNKTMLITAEASSTNPECSDGSKMVRQAYSAVITSGEPSP